ncbi:TetR/AcrR family transcriptional regulator [Planctomonas sp. JC2975]|uniref:TetR/AcrR family transcriptional regulator n=1 Tax=Planctomonas sp. JC2975 TaxID=2729626 RepID=UPI00147668B9|nr:TetR family transcriptional regulator [Planctomonas sp. JC2975]NNC12281.1 TetR/AcrR family transcriptional regulator [Planctomonas sp. JC2975]
MASRIGTGGRATRGSEPAAGSGPSADPQAPAGPEAMDRAALPTSLAAAWGVVDAEGSRGPKPAHSVEEIVAAATELADADGIAAASLPKVAARVGVTANALYRYVSSKDELIVLAADGAWGDPPTLPGGDWRAAASAWSHRLFERFLARPWLLDVPTTVPLTPHNAAWLNALIAALAPTGMTSKELLSCAYLLDSHARYDANLRRNIPTPAALRGSGPERQRTANAVRSFLDLQLRSRGLNAVADVMDDPAFLADKPSMDGFEFGLARILDGISAHVAR